MRKFVRLTFTPIFLIAFAAVPLLASADRIADPSEVQGGGPTVSRPGATMLELLDNVAKPQQLVLPGQCFENGITKDSGEIAQYICQMRNDDKGSILAAPFCSNWPVLEKKIAAISAATGFPSAVMQCTYLIESKFKTGLTSPAGAQGLSQFMPETAQILAASVKKDPSLKGMWDNFKISQCSNPVKTSCDKTPPTKDDILGTTNDIDAQLMATPLYYRQFYASYEKDWANLISDNKDRINDYYHFLVIGYNAGPKRAEQFLRNIKNGVKPANGFLPAETKKYETQLDDCMMNTGTGLKNGVRKDCQDLRKGHKCDDSSSPSV